MVLILNASGHDVHRTHNPDKGIKHLNLIQPTLTFLSFTKCSFPICLFDLFPPMCHICIQCDADDRILAGMLGLVSLPRAIW